MDRRFRYMKVLQKTGAAATALALLTACLTAEAAAAGPALGVSVAAGKAGETVEVIIDIRGVKSPEGAEGISGGEFVLVYDSALAEVKGAEQGKAISGFMFIPNLRLTQNSIKVVWASGSRLISEDGEICRVYFTMKLDGILQPALKDPLLFDQDARALKVEAVDPKPEDDKLPAGGEKEKTPAGRATAEESILQSSPGSTGKSAPDSSSTVSGLPGKKQSDVQGKAGCTSRPETGRPAGDVSASPAAPRTGRPALIAGFLLLAVMILGITGCLLSGYLFQGEHNFER